MAADLEQQKHRCKICSKGFSSGRSLGGHMRSHMRSSYLNTEIEKLENDAGEVSFRAGYDLRENPKKTCRLSDFIGDDFDSSSKYCNVCDKEFPSWKVFFDHMRFHSEVTYNQSLEAEDLEDVEEEEDDDGSWSAHKLSIENFSEDDEPFPPPTIPKKKRRANRVASPIIAASSSSITDYESEQEDVAISLMMLSRDIGGYWVTRVSGVGDPSDKNSVVEEHLDEESSLTWKMNNAKSRSRYQCSTCKKSFHSYHALGGHRASHKRIKTCCLLKTKGEGSKYPGFHNEPSVEHLASKNLKSRAHECAICGKVFSSGHALGGHRRSHLVSNGSNAHRETVANSELLDLNLPAQPDEGAHSFKNEQQPLSSIFD